MKHLKTSALIIVILFALQQNVFAQLDTSIKQFEFMLGNWQMKTSSGGNTETWKKTKAGMFGKSYRYEKEGKPILTESIELKLIDNVFNFSVTGFEEGNKGTTIFKLVSSKDQTYVFENKLHDFPQRIVYQQKDKKNLLAWIEGSINGKMRKMSFPYERKN